MTDEKKKDERTVEAEDDGSYAIECLLGPYRGQILKTTQALAEQGIAEKWARPVTRPPIDHEAPPPDALSAEELDAAVKAANAAAPLLRGEAQPQPVEAEAQPAKAEPVTRDMQAEGDERGSYSTKSTTKTPTRK